MLLLIINSSPLNNRDHLCLGVRALEAITSDVNSLPRLQELLPLTMECIRRLTTTLKGDSPPPEDLKKAADSFLLLFERTIREFLSSDIVLPNAAEEGLLKSYDLLSSVFIELLGLSGSADDVQQSSSVPSWCDILAEYSSFNVSCQIKK